MFSPNKMNFGGCLHLKLMHLKQECIPVGLRTGRSLTVFRRLLLGGGGGVPGRGGCTWSQGGVPGPRGVPGQVPPCEQSEWQTGVTRMHSSRMRTSQSLTIFRSLQPGGVYLVWGGVPGLGGVPGPGGGVPGPGGCTWSRGCTWSWGVYLVPGGVPGPGGVYLVPGGCTWSWGGVPGLGGVPCQVLPPCEQNDKQV